VFVLFFGVVVAIFVFWGRFVALGLSLCLFNPWPGLKRTIHRNGVAGFWVCFTVGLVGERFMREIFSIFEDSPVVYYLYVIKLC
jgi:fucose permease